MLIHAFLRFTRNRLIAAAVVTLVLVLIIHILVSADSPASTPGIFWHYFCGCPPDPNDTVILLRSVNIIACFIGVIVSFNAIPRHPRATRLFDSRRFLLTRPVSRIGVQLYPLLLAFVAIAVFPLAAWALLIGWLRLVHAPSLGHLVAVLELIPAAARLGPHPSLYALARAIDFPRLYVASLSVGLAFYAAFNGSRWFLISPQRWLRILASFWLVFIVVPMNFLPRDWNFQSALLLLGLPGSGLSYSPSNLGIALHFAVAALFLFAAHRTVCEAEL